MPPRTCAICYKKFESAGSRRTHCPACGSAAFPALADPYPGARPPRRRERTAYEALLPVLMFYGSILAVVIAGGAGFIAYRKAADRAAAAKEVAARPTAPAPVPPAPRPAPEPEAGPAAPPETAAPKPGPTAPEPKPEKLDPKRLPPARRGPAGPLGIPGPFRPAAGGAPVVNLANLRRTGGFGPRGDIEVDYEFAVGALNPATDVLVVQTDKGAREVRLIGAGFRAGTVRVRPAAGASLAGVVEVWMERKSAHPDGHGEPISNALSVD